MRGADWPIASVPGVIVAKRQFLPKFAAVICVVATVAILISHMNAWFVGAPEEGSHVQRDFVGAGFSFTLTQRVAGALLEGLPKLAYVLALLAMLRLLWLPRRGVEAVRRALSRTGALMLIGAVLLVVYPIPASIAFSLLEPTDAGLFLLSLPLTVIVTIFGSLLFAATASRVREHLQE